MSEWHLLLGIPVLIGNVYVLYQLYKRSKSSPSNNGL